ncbi:MAG: NAD(P)H-dependent oxidoreductase [Phycisphaerales bacterium]|nr:NAD(P)H-dependent oxidoreductase [Phycisphaerales bacterium]
MSGAPRILALAGSTRKESFNRKMLKLAADAARAAGGTVTHVELADFPMPIFDQDLEAAEGAPPKAAALRKLFAEHQGLLIASPEYNSSVTPLLKNTLDWVSRPSPVEAFKGKVACLIGASPGMSGALRSMAALRSILGNIGVIVLPSQVSVTKAGDAFEADGTLKDAKLRASVDGAAGALVDAVRKLHD